MTKKVAHVPDSALTNLTKAKCHLAPHVLIVVLTLIAIATELNIIMKKLTSIASQVLTTNQ